MTDLVNISKNQSSFWVANSDPCDKACERLFQIGVEQNQGASDGLFAAMKRNNETLALEFGQNNSPSLGFSN